MPHFTICLFLLLLLAPSLQAGGDLPMPPQVREAYARGTRAWDGSPGVRYWQNHASYDIDITVDMQARRIEGRERIRYENRSSDTLRSIVMMLYLNMNRRGGARLSAIGEEALTDGMQIGAMSVNGKDVQLHPGARQVRLDGTVMTVRLPDALAPGGGLDLALRWTAAIPKAEGEDWENPRMGWYERDAMFLGYFYPRIAMYDDVRGWDTQQYDGVHEFYHGYGDYTLSVTLPAGYGVWATGELNNADALLPEHVRARLAAARASDTVLHIVTQEDLDAQVYGASGARTWEFSAEMVNDIACGIGRYLWDAAGSEVAPGRRVLCQAAFHPTASTYSLVAGEMTETLRMLSTGFPGVPYAYPQITVFHGHSGMEFPMLLNDGEFEQRVLHVYVHAHEAAHSWMPFMVGIDETRWGWMEEGMAYFLPVEVQNKQSGYDHRLRAAQGYARFSGRLEDYPIMTPSTASPFNEWQMLDYYKAAVAFDMLRRTVGEERFTSALRVFITRWRNRHPLPWDFFHTFNEVTGEDLAWFWMPWFFEQGQPDLALETVETKGDTVSIHVRKAGSMPVPIHLTLQLENGETMQLTENTAAWKDTDTVVIRAMPVAAVTAVTLGDPYIPDADPDNNSWTR